MPALRKRGAAIAALAWSIALVARAENAMDAREGRDLALKACAPCHRVEGEPSGERASPLAGPTFADIARGQRAAPQTLRDFLRATHNDVGHPLNMPNPELTEEQIRLISAYLSRLRALQ
jgi:mono/diheme cytochrome c family protein